ncbi:porin [Bradyrhizobium sp. Pear77]|uniref:porin n=1 Tax=Bradyrhizobium altum TaxID=1571202 RepID=UPI0028991DAF|nr:porin [Bradyrhizobium altum]MCC8957586.1 porin [Bradyrhizobium altum]
MAYADSSEDLKQELRRLQARVRSLEATEQTRARNDSAASKVARPTPKEAEARARDEGARLHAQAADVPVAKIPVDYVKICDAYGPGYFYIPSVRTCLNISGYVRSDTGTGNTTTGSDIGIYRSGILHGASDRGTRKDSENIEASVNFDAKTATDWGLLHSLVNYRVDYATAASQTATSSGVPSITFDRGYLEMNGFKAGRDETNYNFLFYRDIFYSNIFWQFEPFVDYKVNQAAYTANFGNGFTGTISVEDPTTGGTNRSNSLPSAAIGRRSGASFVYGSMDLPDLIGNLRVSQAWGAAQLSVGYHQDYGSVATPYTANGYGGQAAVSFNVPALGAGSRLAFQGAYSIGATSLAYSWGYQGGAFGISSADLGADAAVANGVLQQAREWTVGTVFEVHMMPTVEFDASSAYYSFRNRNTAGTLAFTGFETSAQIKWTPIGPELQIIPELEYRHIDVSAATVAAGNATFNKADAYVFDMRFLRKF